MDKEPGKSRLEPDASELILCDDDRFSCESFIFEPSVGEKSLGRLYMVSEAESRGGVGKELINLVAQALQREYYRDPSRGVLASFESALHQANLVLNDSAEQGVRDWMGYFHSVIAVLANNSLHISAAGNGCVFLVRHSKVTLISADLAHSPITNPLHTFAQVASGTLIPRDVMYLSTSAFPQIFRPEDLSRFAIEHSVATISMRLQQLYMDQGAQAPLAALVVSILPEHVAAEPRRIATKAEADLRRPRRDVTRSLAPRQPITIHRTALHAIVSIGLRFFSASWQWFKQSAFPMLVKGSRKSGRTLVAISAVTGRNVQALTKKKWKRSDESSSIGNIGVPQKRITMPTISSWPKRILNFIFDLSHSLPRTSKVFLVVTIILAIALGVSLMFLKNKRVEDAQVQRASELLHEGQTKQSAAESALIYNNRTQAQKLVDEANQTAQQLAATHLYTKETQELAKNIANINDRLQKVMHASNSMKTVGDFNKIFTSTPPTHLAFVNGAIYGFNSESNQIGKMGTDGVASLVSDKTQGIGFFIDAVSHAADKDVIFITNTPGVAIFDTKTNSLAGQDIGFTNDKPNLTAVGVFGSRLYVYDSTAHNIFLFNKTLRGYTGGSAWITDATFPKDTIKSFAIDGSVYTLNSDGTIKKLYKGVAAKFTMENVTPSLSGATKIITNEDLKSLYVLDPANKRVVIFTKTGQLVQQIMVDVKQELRDVAISSDESTLYALDGSQVLAVSLAAPAAN